MVLTRGQLREMSSQEDARGTIPTGKPMASKTRTERAILSRIPAAEFTQSLDLLVTSPLSGDCGFLTNAPAMAERHTISRAVEFGVSTAPYRERLRARRSRNG